MNILKILLRIFFFVILLILAINNLQSIEFNFLGLYFLKLPLILILAIFAIAGFFLGLLIGAINNFSLKSQLNKFKKQQLHQVETKE